MFLKSEDQYRIIEISNCAIELNPSLNRDRCYAITLLYYLTQFCNFDFENIPLEYMESIRLLYKNPKSSYIHYRTEIMYSNDIYAKTIKAAEIKLAGGDDPRCPW